MSKTKGPHGGKRPGAGRKVHDPEMRAIPFATRLPSWLVNWLRQQPEPQSKVVQRALEQYYRANTPTKDKTMNSETTRPHRSKRP